MPLPSSKTGFSGRVISWVVSSRSDTHSCIPTCSSPRKSPVAHPQKSGPCIASVLSARLPSHLILYVRVMSARSGHWQQENTRANDWCGAWKGRALIRSEPTSDDGAWAQYGFVISWPKSHNLGKEALRLCFEDEKSANRWQQSVKECLTKMISSSPARKSEGLTLMTSPTSSVTSLLGRQASSTGVNGGPPPAPATSAAPASDVKCLITEMASSAPHVTLQM